VCLSHHLKNKKIIVTFCSIIRVLSVVVVFFFHLSIATLFSTVQLNEKLISTYYYLKKCINCNRKWVVDKTRKKKHKTRRGLIKNIYKHNKKRKKRRVLVFETAHEKYAFQLKYDFFFSLYSYFSIQKQQNYVYICSTSSRSVQRLHWINKDECIWMNKQIPLLNTLFILGWRWWCVAFARKIILYRLHYYKE
jgi:hypothetical protein